VITPTALTQTLTGIKHKIFITFRKQTGVPIGTHNYTVNHKSCETFDRKHNRCHTSYCPSHTRRSGDQFDRKLKRSHHLRNNKKWVQTNVNNKKQKLSMATPRIPLHRKRAMDGDPCFSVCGRKAIIALLVFFWGWRWYENQNTNLRFSTNHPDVTLLHWWQYIRVVFHLHDITII
jgi:hypothetical protein